MDIDQFWSIIEIGKDTEEPEAVLAEELDRLSTEEVSSFQEHMDILMEKAYTWDLWGAAYLAEGGCSDDGFIDFRYGLIAKGREIFEHALANPDSLASIEADRVSNELFGYVPAEVYESKTKGGVLHRKLSMADEPIGEEFDFDNDEEMSGRYPDMYLKYAEYQKITHGSTDPDKKPWWKIW